MIPLNQDPERTDANEFADLSQERQMSLIEELIVFVKENKAYWMIPILLVFGLIGLLMVLVNTGAAPFIYTLF